MIGVAWGFVAVPTPELSYLANVEGEHQEWWNENAPSGWPPAEISRAEHASRVGTLQETLSSSMRHLRARRTLAGWPFYSVEGAVWSDMRTGRADLVSGTFVRQHLLPVPPFRYGAPTQIRWPGQVANTLVYAVLLAVPWLYWRLRVAHFRRKRRQCVACGYAAGVSPKCSECGHTLRVR